MVLDPSADLVTLLRSVVDIESVSDHETHLADEIQAVLDAAAHLEVIRDGDVVVARTHLGRDQRVVVAGHLDTVPVAGNLPSTYDPVTGRIYGRGSCDMKGGIAVMLAAAVGIPEPVHDVTWVFYDHEEVEATRNGLGRVAASRPELLAGDLAVLMEPTAARVEGGCQGSVRAWVEAHGVAAHAARSWLGRNAIHELAPALDLLAAWQVRDVEVDGLIYREGLNAVRIEGGIAGNVVPDHARIEVNHRFAPNITPEEAVARVNGLFPDYTVTVIDLSPAARPGLDHPAAQDFLRAVGGDVGAKYGWTDVARFAQLGIPAVNFGPGNANKAHADDEFCPASDLQICHDALVRWLSA